VVLIVLLLLPAVMAERYTSPTQDGQYVLNPLKGWGFVFALIGVDDSATLGSSGEALKRARVAFMDSSERPVKVELLYLSDADAYVYVKKTGRTLLVTAPPRLMWEVWGRSRDQTSADEPLDVIGFLDYGSGRLLGLSDPAGRTQP
jgi:hypothetical protein